MEDWNAYKLGEIVTIYTI